MGIKTRLETLENITRTINFSDTEILRLFGEPWEKGEYEDVTDASWRPGQPAIELARCAWLHYIATGGHPPFDFECFIQVFVDGVNPAFL